MGRPATLKVDIIADAKGVSKGVDEADRKFSGLGKTLGTLAKVGGVVGGLAAVGGVLRQGVSDAVQYTKLQSQTAAALKSTGGQAHVTAQHVSNLADKIEAYSTIDDAAVHAGENLLLTFTNIRNEAGRGNDVFDQTTKIMADMSTALGQDTTSSALQLGKALNDPIKGVTALQRVGVSFTAQQREQIKAMVDAGNTIGAQKLILGELSKEFGGSAAAAAQSTGGLVHLKEAFQDTVRDGIVKILPYVNQFADWLLTKAWPAVQKVASNLAANLGPALRNVGHFIVDDVVPAVTALVSWFATKLVPLIAKSVRPIVEAVAGVFRNLAAHLENNNSGLGKLVNVLRILAEFIAGKVMPIVGKFIAFYIKTLGVEIGIVLDVVNDLINALGWVIDKLGKIGSLVGGTLGKAAGLIGKLNPFGGVPVVGGVAQLVGGVGGVIAPTGRLVTAMAGDPLPGAYSVRPGGALSGAIIVDRRDFSTNVRVDGALDPVSVGQQLDEILTGHRVRLGQIPAWGSGGG